jgi:hypothetical protein
MKPKLLSALAVVLVVMLPGSPLFAQAAFPLAPRSFDDKDPRVYGPLRETYSASANKEVQVLLTLSGYYHGPIDGNVTPGSPTSIAIVSYQRDHKMPITGLINGALLASLNSR